MSPNVQIIAMPRALLRIGQRMRHDRHARAEQRRHDVPAEQRTIPIVVRMRDERDARRQQFGTGGLDLDAAASWPIEPQAVIGALPLAILELRLGHGCPEIDVPERRRLQLIRQALLQQPQKRRLATRAASACRSSRTSSTSPPTARDSARDARTPSRLPSSVARRAR